MSEDPAPYNNQLPLPNRGKLPEGLVVIDCETTGLDPARCGLLEIAAVTAGGEEFHALCRPDHPETCLVEPQAMAVNGQNWEEARARTKTAAAAAFELAEWLRQRLPEGCRRWIHAGRNPSFDRAFLLAALAAGGHGGETLPCSRRLLDQHAVAYWWAVSRGIDIASPDFSTDLVYRHHGFAPESRPHRALAGARLCAAVFHLMATKTGGTR